MPKYRAMTVDEAGSYLKGKLDPVMFKLVDEEMSGAEYLIYAETLRLHQRIDEIENQASEMMSPEKMMELAGGFLGNGVQPSILG